MHGSRSVLLNPTPALTTARLRLDPLAVDDAGQLAAAMADPGLFTFIGGAPPMVGELRRRVRRYRAGPRTSGEAWHNWAIRLAIAEEDSDHLIGQLQATVRDVGASAEVAWLVGTPWQGRGYASEAAVALVDWLVRNGARHVIAHIAPGHAGSGRVATRAGLQPTDVVEGGEVLWTLHVVDREA